MVGRSKRARRGNQDARRACLAFTGCLLFLMHLACSGGGSGDAPVESSQPAPSGATPSPNGIARENALAGTSAWRIGNPSANGEIAAYTDRESYAAGTDVRVSVSADPAGSFRWQVFRMGGYRGMGGRLYAQGGPIEAPRQADPSFEPGTGLLVAGWPVTFSFSTRQNDGTPWLTGVCVVLLSKADGRQTYAIFILRDDTRHAEVALHIPTATSHAYNDFGGESLYVSARGLGHARKVSLDRPITLGSGSGKFLNEEHEGVLWLEDAGYDVEYLSSTDLGGAVNRLGAHRIYISLGHDEYATMAVLDRLEAALAAGTQPGVSHRQHHGLSDSVRNQ